MSGQGEAAETKSWWSLQEVCARLGLEPHVLRYWETEFPQLRPRKGSNGSRQYRDKELATIERIRVLLLEEKLTLQAARKRLVEDRRIDTAGQFGLLLPEPAKEDKLELDRDGMARELREVLDILRFGRRSW